MRSPHTSSVADLPGLRVYGFGVAQKKAYLNCLDPSEPTSLGLQPCILPERCAKGRKLSRVQVWFRVSCSGREELRGDLLLLVALNLFGCHMVFTAGFISTGSIDMSVARVLTTCLGQAFAVEPTLTCVWDCVGGLKPCLEWEAL